MMAEFSIVPLGKGASVSDVIARSLKVIIDSGIRYKANPWARCSKESGRW